MVTDKNKNELKGIVGDYDWEQTRDSLVIGLISCNTQDDFLKIFQGIINSIGTYRDLKEVRKKLEIHPFTNEDKQKFKDLKKK